MPKLVHDIEVERRYEGGTSLAVLYPYLPAQSGNPKGMVWNGVTKYKEAPEGGESKPLSADDMTYASIQTAEKFKASLEAYTYPDAFEACIGNKSVAAGVTIGQQKKVPFGFVCKTKIGNAKDGLLAGYKIHIVWKGIANPVEKEYSTIGEDFDPSTFSIELTAESVTSKGNDSTATMTIDSTKIKPAALKLIEDKLYGSETAEAELPTPDEIIQLISGVA